MVVVEEMLEPGRIVGHDAGHAQLFRPPEVRLLVKHPQVGRDSSLPAHNSSYSSMSGGARQQKKVQTASLTQLPEDKIYRLRKK